MAINVLKGLRNRAASAPSEPEEHPLDRPPGGPRVACSNCGRPLGLTEVRVPRLRRARRRRRPAQARGRADPRRIARGTARRLGARRRHRPGRSARRPGRQRTGRQPGTRRRGRSVGRARPGQRSGVADRRGRPQADRRHRGSPGRLGDPAQGAAEGQVVQPGQGRHDHPGDRRRRRPGQRAGRPARRLAGRGPAPGAAPGFYLAVRQSARDALGVSMENGAKYKAAAKRMIKLARLGPGHPHRDRGPGHGEPAHHPGQAGALIGRLAPCGRAYGP